MGKRARLFWFTLSLLAVLGLSGLGAVWAGDDAPVQVSAPGDLTGKLLVASPSLHDPRFAKSLVYIVDHDETGAFGLIVNKAYGVGPLDKFLAGFGIEAADGLDGDNLKLVFGGPVETDSLFLLHSADYQGKGTEVIDGRFAVTARLDALKDMAEGRGPERFIMAVGYAGWAPGQLEGELDRGDWDVGTAELDLVFGTKTALEKWQTAREALGHAL